MIRNYLVESEAPYWMHQTWFGFKTIVFAVALVWFLVVCWQHGSAKNADAWNAYDAKKESFHSFCDDLDAQTIFRSEAWVCIKDKDVAYQRDPAPVPTTGGRP